jgi:hypothetical protein
MFHLSGHNLHVSYATTGFDGKPHLHYQDATHALDFAGDQIRAVECDLGMLVSVSIQRTVDAGSTSFSLLVPRVTLEAGQSQPIHTEGVTTVHRFSIVPMFNRGQLDGYSVHALSGTAQFLMF